MALLSVLNSLASVLPFVRAPGTISEEIEKALGTSTSTGPPEQASRSVDTDVLVSRFYQQREFAPAWAEPERAEELFAALERAFQHGFKPTDFNVSKLRSLLEDARAGGEREQAIFDVFATKTAVKLVQHLMFGKVDPAAFYSNWNFSEPGTKRNLATLLNTYLNEAGIEALVDRLSLTNPQYILLVEALTSYRSISEKGGWPKVPSQDVLKPGTVGPAIAVLRKRLAAENALTSTQSPTPTEDGTDPTWVYDDQLVEDVRTFQARHGLEADGVIGAKTFGSLNKPVEDRVNKLRLSLERGRWLMRDLDEEFVLVNIAGARTYLVKADRIRWTARSVTGTALRKTPVFRDAIQYMEFNPTWTVPASVFRKDKLEEIRKDIGYLERNNFSVKDRDGQMIPGSSVDWDAEDPGVTLVQQPGADNMLGLVKFMFPNKHSVYLHDTNEKPLFDRNERYLSSGCVRLEHPFEFANLLLESDPDWSHERMQSILDSGKTTRIDLPQPIPVLLT